MRYGDAYRARISEASDWREARALAENDMESVAPSNVHTDDRADAPGCAQPALHPCDDLRDKLHALLLARGMLSYNRALDRVHHEDAPSAKTRDWQRTLDRTSNAFHEALDKIEAEVRRGRPNLIDYLEDEA